MKNNITAILAEKKKSQGWLAQRTGIRRDYINRIASGKVEPGIEKALKILAALKVTAGTIWPYKGVK